MDQEQQARLDDKELAPNSHQQGVQQRARDDDSTWGIGAASALDSLRRQNFRGKRASPDDEGKPSSR